MPGMDDSASLGRFIRESRLKKGMSLGQLAAALDRSSSSVRRWERDEVAPAITIMPALAEVLGVDVGVLEAMRPSFGWSDDVDPEPPRTEERPATHDQPVVAPMAVQVPEAPSHRGRPAGFFSDLWQALFSSKETWIGWARGVATAVALIVMVVILWWAIGELWDGLREIWRSFGAGDVPS